MDHYIATVNGFYQVPLDIWYLLLARILCLSDNLKSSLKFKIFKWIIIYLEAI